MLSQDWEKWVPVVAENNKRLEKIEKQVEEIHNVVYKNGISAKVNTLWSINRIVLSIITAVIIGVAIYFITQPVNSDIEKKLEKIERKLDKVKDQN